MRNLFWISVPTLLLVVLLLTGCAGQYYAKVGVGASGNLLKKSSHQWENQGSLGCTFGVGNRHHVYKKLYGDANLTHYSQCFVGKPFDDLPESSLDHAGYNLEYRF